MRLSAPLASRNGSAAATALFLLSLVTRVGAQAPVGQGHAAPAPAASSLLLPTVPRLQLSLPALASSAVPREGSRGLGYLRTAVVPREWRHVTDAELRLEIATARVELGRLSLSSQLEAVPGRERGCLPDCRAPEWSPALQLKYHTGDVGPLRQTGPQLRLQGARPPGSGQAGRRFLGAGFSGKF